MALAASRLGVPGAGRGRRRARAARDRRPGRRPVVGGAPVRRRHLAHPGAGPLHRRRTPTPRTRSTIDRLGAAGWVVQGAQGRARGASRSRRVPTSSCAEDAVIEEQTDPWRVVGLGPGRSSSASLSCWPCCWCRCAKRAAARPAAAYDVVVGALRQRLAGGARRRSRPGHAGARHAGAASRRPSALGVGRRPRAAGRRRRLRAAARRAAEAARSGTTCQELRRQLLAEADLPHRLWSHFNPASLLAGWARRRSRDAQSRAGGRRRSPCPASAARGRVTTRPTPGRGPRATPARRGRPA